MSDFPKNNIYHLIDINSSSSFSTKSAVFLDRDGVINEEKHLLHTLDEFEMIKNSAEAIRSLNLSGIPVIVIHNASVVCRGLCDLDMVIKINERMKEELSLVGARLDAILFCPHHVAANNKNFARDCNWRKPGIGMIDYSSRTLGVDPKRSFVIGDSAKDVELGNAVEATTVLLETGHAGKDASTGARPDFVASDLFSAVNSILSRGGR